MEKQCTNLQVKYRSVSRQHCWRSLGGSRYTVSTCRLRPHTATTEQQLFRDRLLNQAKWASTSKRNNIRRAESGCVPGETVIDRGAETTLTPAAPLLSLASPRTGQTRRRLHSAKNRRRESNPDTRGTMPEWPLYRVHIAVSPAAFRRETATPHHCSQISDTLGNRTHGTNISSCR